MGRPTKVKTELRSLEDCNRALGELREAQTDLTSLTADRDRAVAATQARFEEGMDAAKSTAAELEAALKAYYYGHLPEVERDGAKHVQLANGRIGRRDNPPALRPLNRKWSKPAILNAVRAMFGRRHLRVKEEVDLVALKEAQLAVEVLKQLGLKVTTDETFYAEPATLPVGEGR